MRAFIFITLGMAALCEVIIAFLSATQINPWAVATTGRWFLWFTVFAFIILNWFSRQKGSNEDFIFW